MARRLRKTVNSLDTVIQIVENLRRSWFLQRDVAGDYLFEYHEDDPIWDFNPAIRISARFAYRARRKAQFMKEVAAYLAAQELASRQISGYLVTEGQRSMRYTNVDYSSDYSLTVDTHPMYSEPEVTNPWHISGIGEWDELYGDVSA
jgi:hypothetical protein